MQKPIEKMGFQIVWGPKASIPKEPQEAPESSQEAPEEFQNLKKTNQQIDPILSFVCQMLGAILGPNFAMFANFGVDGWAEFLHFVKGGPRASLACAVLFKYLKMQGRI